MKTIEAYFFSKSVNRKTNKPNYIRFDLQGLGGKVCILNLGRDIYDNDPELIAVVKTKVSRIDKKEKCDIFRGFKEVVLEPLTEGDINEIKSICYAEPDPHRKIGVAKLGDGDIVDDGRMIYFKIGNDLVTSHWRDANLFEIDFHDPKLYTYKKRIEYLPLNYYSIVRPGAKISRVFVKGELRVVEYDSGEGASQYHLETLFPTILEVDVLASDADTIAANAVDTSDPNDVHINMPNGVLNLSEFKEVECLSDLTWHVDPVILRRDISAYDYQVNGADDLPAVVTEGIKNACIGVGTFKEVGTQCAYILDYNWYYYLKGEDREDVLDFLYGINVVGREQADIAIKNRMANLSTRSLDASTVQTMNAYKRIARFYDLYRD